jgi:hypothetical protein
VWVLPPAPTAVSWLDHAPPVCHTTLLTSCYTMQYMLMCLVCTHRARESSYCLVLCWSGAAGRGVVELCRASCYCSAKTHKYSLLSAMELTCVCFLIASNCCSASIMLCSGQALLDLICRCTCVHYTAVTQFSVCCCRC